jgi:hypothetical protein
MDERRTGAFPCRNPTAFAAHLSEALPDFLTVGAPIFP